VTIDKDNTTIVEGEGSTKDIQGRIYQIRRQIEETTSDYDREKTPRFSSDALPRWTSNDWTRYLAAATSIPEAPITSGGLVRCEHLGQTSREFRNARKQRSGNLRRGLAPSGKTGGVCAAGCFPHSGKTLGCEGSGNRGFGRSR
jgi:hypothetical protein